MALSGAPERATFVTSDPGLSPRIALCHLLRGVVPWSPVIPVEVDPIDPGGDTTSVRSSRACIPSVWKAAPPAYPRTR